MKIILAPDSYKGSLSSTEVSQAMAVGIREMLPEAELIQVPMADGGEGTVEAVVATTGGKLVEIPVHDPLGREIRASFGLTGDGKTAIIEMAAASGLPLLTKAEQNPLLTSTYGTGELIKAALEYQVERIILGIGGSATNDGGKGMAEALGARFLDDSGRELAPGGGSLVMLAKIDLTGLDPRLAEVKFQVACDVTNPLTGPNGAAVIYAPQKGATLEMVLQLDRGLANLAAVVKTELGIEINDLPGAGAAGGLGGGLVAFLGAELSSGIELVMQVTKFAEYLDEADLVFTGEGRIDSQSAFGKTISGIGRVALANNVPVIAIAGSLGDGYEAVYQAGITGVSSIISKPMSLSEALDSAAELIAAATSRSLRLFLAGKNSIN